MQVSSQLPPLNAIRAFEAAGRCGSFKSAAEEMNVTPGAVSRQIALLEEHLGLVLFERRHRQVVLSKEGRAYLATVVDVLGRLRAATTELQQARDARPLHIWCPMTFGMRWLAPRLPKFRARHPGREVAITTSLGPVDVELHRTDIAIRIGRGRWPGLVSRRLVSIELTPVCSPRLLEALGRRMTLDDLRGQTLLQSAARPDYWGLWLRAVGAGDIDSSRGMSVESVSLAWQLAAEGAGIAMGQYALVQADLASGRLVMPFEHIERTEDAFCLLYPSGQRSNAYVQAFADWLVDEARRAEALRGAAPTMARDGT